MMKRERKKKKKENKKKKEIKKDTTWTGPHLYCDTIGKTGEAHRESLRNRSLEVSVQGDRSGLRHNLSVDNDAHVYLAPVKR